MAEDVAIRIRLREARRFQADAKRSADSIHGVGRAADRASRQTDVASNRAERYRRGLVALRGAAIAGSAVLAVGLVRGAFAATKSASALSEQVNKTGAVFKGSAPEIQAWAKTTADSIGISNRAALQATGVFGNMLVPMGIGRTRAAEMSRGMVTLAADMASFNDASPEEVLDALRAGLAGESEPLRRYGVFLNDARLKEEAFRMGLYEGTGVLGARAKALATQALILRDTRDAQGDFNRTRDAAANAERRARANIEDLSAAIGSRLLPAYRSALGVVNRFLAGMKSGQGPGGRFARTMRDIADEVGPLARQIATALVPAGAGLVVVMSTLGGPLTLVGQLIRLAGEHGTTTKVVVIALTTAFVTYRVALIASAAASRVQATIAALQAGRLAFLTGATRAQTLATIRATFAQRGLNVAMRLNPIGLVITALVALGIGLVLAWRRFETFRNVVKGTWSWIKANWPLLVAIITGPIGLAVRTVIRNFGRIKSAARAVIDFIVRQWQRLPQPVRDFAGGRLPSLPSSVGGIPTGPSVLDLIRAPFQAEGGITRRSGFSVVGERGPELLSLPRAARVDPLPLPAAVGPRELVIHLHNHNTTTLDGKVIARSTNRQVRREAALA